MKIRNKDALKLLTLPLVLLLSLFWVPGEASATSCTPSIGSMKITLPTKTIQRDVPVGTILATAVSGVRQIYSCTGTSDGSIYGVKSLGGYVSSINGARIYQTNVPGIGYSIGANGCGGPYHVYIGQGSTNFGGINATSSCASSGLFGAPKLSVEASIFKTGPTGSGAGKPTGSIIYLVNSAGWQQEIPIDIDFSIKTVACSITTSSVRVPLDDVLASRLTSVGTTIKPSSFNVGLNCEAGARVNAKLTGTKNTDTSTNGVLQLTGAGTAGVASGVGIQLLYNNTPLELNKNIVLNTSAGGQETYPFIAQYYQTRTAVTAGSANATATLEMTYQ